MVQPWDHGNEAFTTAWFGGSSTSLSIGSGLEDSTTRLSATPRWSTRREGQTFGSARSGMALPPHTILAGRYRVEQVLGAGAFATVHAAWDLGMNRWVAVKMYHAGVAGAVSADEAQLQASCQHPNLMPLHDAGTDGRLGISYLVMPLYPGADLAGTLDRYGPLPFRAAMQCVDQVCSALEFLWLRRQAIHGDIKPANIWLTQSGAALLMDFNVYGLLARGHCLRAGTPGYTAPEALMGRMDRRSDVFALGCVLYRCLAGSAPFADDAAAQAGRPIPLKELRPDVRPELEALVKMAMHPDPEQRFQTPRELQSALRSPARVMALAGGGWSMVFPRAGRLMGRGLAAGVALGGNLLASMARGSGRMLEWGFWGVGGLLGEFCRRLCRRPVQTLMEGLLLGVLGEWAFYAGMAWAQAHVLMMVGMLMAAMLMFSGPQSRRRRRRRF